MTRPGLSAAFGTRIERLGLFQTDGPLHGLNPSPMLVMLTEANGPRK